MGERVQLVRGMDRDLADLFIGVVINSDGADMLRANDINLQRFMRLVRPDNQWRCGVGPNKEDRFGAGDIAFRV